ncbi:MAG: retropepsin-like aspartic protease [Acidobacteriota bacterium]|nr:retropepsin-like aspartic protease [Acidobacteriota bacterium]
MLFALTLFLAQVPDLDQAFDAMTGKGVPTEVTLGFTRHEHGMVVGARINGKGPFYFVVDTGAAATVISDKVAEQSGLVPTGKKAHVVGISGKRMHAWVGRATDLSVSGAKARQMEIMVRDIKGLNEQGLAGLLGQDFLGRFHVNIDNKGQKITLALPGEGKPPVVSSEEKLMREILDQPDRLADEIGRLDLSLASWLRLYQEGESSERADRKKDLDAWITQLRDRRRQFERVHGTLHAAPTARLSGERKNNLQRYLYCYPAYRRYADSVIVLADALSESWTVDAAPAVGQAAAAVSERRKALAGCAPKL